MAIFFRVKEKYPKKQIAYAALIYEKFSFHISPLAPL
jgi:hypothetical protein